MLKWSLVLKSLYTLMFYRLFDKWLTGDRPANGSLVKLVTKDNKTELVIV